ncbi:MAG: tRNA (adenosine(37)-N6)-threonylcarbamoyltransferase complex dimerization subunit type 1 TsaB [Bacilli bacterium]|nr:tRNA (adenosine(37)-N6)-threonylcarbamoyltransferase complex dimerization subunit type 1 TsaB [Bacilli bacterium]
MKILYLDTSSSFLYCAIIKENNCIGQIKLKLDRDLSSLALSEVSNLFVSTSTDPIDIDKIIVVNGPGSFTGIRVGLTIAKTFAWGLNKKISTISSLEAMAISDNSDNDYFIPIIDARRGYVYSGIFDRDGNEILKGQYINIEVLKATLDNLPGKYVLISNDKLNSFDNTNKYDPDFVAIVNKYKERPEINPHAVDALYLKLTEAEEKLND